MENRRRDYRHPFAAPHRLRVAFLAADDTVLAEGDIANLSVSGMAVVFRHGPPQVAQERWLARLGHPFWPAPLLVPCSLVHAQPAEPYQAGFRFLPMANPTATEERERLLWSFLLEQQRQSRRGQQTRHAS